MKKERTLNELRQVKDTVYSNKKVHGTTNKTEYVFSKKGLINLLEQYQVEYSRDADIPEETKDHIRDFVNTIIP
tara:strand:- start:251 stop:472 length:222 start_codon:yes stop_codon:yes gene_type:complete